MSSQSHTAEHHKGFLPAPLHNLLFDMFENKDSRKFVITNDILVGLIIFSAVATIIESMEILHGFWHDFFFYTEWVVVGLFTLEYLIELYLAKPKRKYVFSFFGIIDLLAILPSYLLLLDFRFLKLLHFARILRFLRILRLGKLAKLQHERGQDRIKTAKQIIQLNITLYFTAMAVLITFVGTLMHQIEHEVEGTSIHTVLDGMWLAISTVTTVTFGDVYPVTGLGKIVTGATMISGLALLGLMVLIVGHTIERLLFGSTTGVDDDEDADLGITTVEEIA